MPRFSVIIPTIGRDTLPRTLISIPDSVEKIVVADTHGPLLTDVAAVCEKYDAKYIELDAGKHDTGSSQIDYGMRQAKGDYLLNFGDDDVYEPFAFAVMTYLTNNIDDPIPLMFRVALHPTWPDPRRGNFNIAVIWKEPEMVDKNITGQCFVVPNIQDKLGNWFGNVDSEFMMTTVEKYDGKIHFRPEIIAQCY